MGRSALRIFFLMKPRGGRFQSGHSFRYGYCEVLPHRGSRLPKTLFPSEVVAGCKRLESEIDWSAICVGHGQEGCHTPCCRRAVEGIQSQSIAVKLARTPPQRPLPLSQPLRWLRLSKSPLLQSSESQQRGNGISEQKY